MSEIYAFLFCLALGAAARIIYILETKLAARTNIYPVTVALDILVMCAVGGAFICYVLFTGVPLAPYMFAALFAGYYFTYLFTRKK